MEADDFVFVRLDGSPINPSAGNKLAPEAGFEPTPKRLTATIKRSADSYA